MKLLPVVVALFAVVRMDSATAAVDPELMPSWSVGISDDHISPTSDFGGASIALRVRQDNASALVFLAGGRMTNNRRSFSPDDVSTQENASASMLIGQRRYFNTIKHTRFFGDALLGAVIDEAKFSRTHINYSSLSGSSETKTYSHSAALGWAAALSVGGEYLFHARAGIELSTNLVYSRLMWNFASTSKLKTARLSSGSHIGIIWYW